MNQCSLPFSKEADDPLFVEGRDLAKSQGIPLNEADLYHIYVEVIGHILYAIQISGKFWEKFLDTDRIDVAHRSKTLFVLILIRTNLRGFSIETKARSFMLLSTRNNQFVRQATNIFLNLMVQELKKPCRELAYASL